MKTIKKASLLFASLALVLGAGLVGNSDTKEVKAASGDTYTFSDTKGTSADGNWSFTTKQNNGSTQPAFTSSKELRLYPKNSITFKAKEGVTLNNASFSITINANKKGIKPTGWSTSAGNITDYANTLTSFTVNDINSSEFTITISGTAGNIGFKTIAMDYTSETADAMTGIVIEGDIDNKVYKQNANWDVTGLTVKANYESGKEKVISNSSVDWKFDKNPSEFEPGTGYSINVTALYGDASAKKSIDGIEIIESPRVYSFSSMKGFDTWGSGYEQHVDYLTYPGLKIVLEKANKNSKTITDVPVTKGNNVEIIVTDNTTLSVAAFTFKQWGSKAQIVRLYTSTDAGQTYSSSPLTSSSSFTIPETTLPENTNALKITFSSQENQVGLVDFQLRKGKDTVENFVSNWKTFRANGGNDGICYYLTEANREALEIMLARYNTFDVTDKTIIDATTDVEGVTIGETIAYLKNVLAGSTKTNGDYGIQTASGVVITSNNSYDKTSLIALFAILGIITISGYYIIEKKKFSK